MRPALLLVALVAMQVTLGALTVLSRARSLDQQLPRRLRRAGADDVAGDDAAKWRGRFADCSGPAKAGRLRTSTASALASRASAGPPSIGRAPRISRDRRGPRVKDAPTRRRRRIVAAETAAPSASFADYLALTKPRLNFLVVATSAAGYYLGATGSADAGADGAGGRRHGARRRRRGGAQSGVRARHRRADAADAAAPAARRPRGARRCARCSASALSAAGLVLLAARANWLAAGARAGDAGRLPRWSTRR